MGFWITAWASVGNAVLTSGNALVAADVSSLARCTAPSGLLVFPAREEGCLCWGVFRHELVQERWRHASGHPNIRTGGIGKDDCVSR